VSTLSAPRVRPFFRRLIAIGLGFLVLYVGWSAWDYVEARRFDAALDALRARHVPTSVPRIEDSDAIPDAMRFYAAAAQLASPARVPVVVERALMNLNRGWPVTAQDRSAIDGYVSTNSAAFELVDRADALAVRDAPASGSRSILFDLGRLASVLSVRTRALARNGRLDEAGNALSQELNLLRAFEHIESDPENGPRFGAATRPSLVRGMCRDLEVVLNSGRPSVAVIERLRSGFALNLSSDLGHAITSDARLLIDLSDTVVHAPQRTLRLDVSLPSFSDNLMRPAYRRGLADSLSVLAAVSDASRESTPRMLRLVATIESEHPRIAPIRQLWNITPLIVGWSVYSAQTVASAQALSAAARIALSVEHFRADHGGLPTGLADLVPAYLEAIPADPYDGAPMRFRVDANGYTVYGVGLNAKDDNGNLSQRLDEGLKVGRR
jgi:hypothetical protein